MPKYPSSSFMKRKKAALHTQRSTWRKLSRPEKRPSSLIDYSANFIMGLVCPYFIVLEVKEKEEETYPESLVRRKSLGKRLSTK